MSQTDNSPPPKKSQYIFNMTLAAVAGQVGCLTTVLVVGALLAGLWLDSRLDTRPTFTIIFLVGSVPFTLAGMFWVVRKVTSRIQSDTQDPDIKEKVQEE